MNTMPIGIISLFLVFPFFLLFCSGPPFGITCFNLTASCIFCRILVLKSPLLFIFPQIILTFTMMRLDAGRSPGLISDISTSPLKKQYLLSPKRCHNIFLHVLIVPYSFVSSLPTALMDKTVRDRQCLPQGPSLCSPCCREKGHCVRRCISNFTVPLKYARASTSWFSLCLSVPDFPVFF